MTINRAREQPCASTIRGRRTGETATRLATSNGFRKYPPGPTTSTTRYKLGGPFWPGFFAAKGDIRALKASGRLSLYFPKAITSATITPGIDAERLGSADYQPQRPTIDGHCPVLGRNRGRT